MVGHAPVFPGSSYDLVDPETADPAAWTRVETGYPPGTLAVLELSTNWDDLAVISLIAAHGPTRREPLLGERNMVTIL